MAQPLYLQPSEVAPIPGRFADLWRVMGDPATPGVFSDAQLQLVEEASRTIDDVTGQDGGLLTQTDKTVHIIVRETGDTLWLPNKPIGPVSAITVYRAAQTIIIDPASVEYDGVSNFITCSPWSAPGQIPTGLQAMTLAMDGALFPFAERDRVDVTYSCGYAIDELPATIRDVCRRIVAEAAFSLQENPVGATEIRQGQSMYRFGTTDYINPVDIRTRRALMPYTIAVR